MGQECSCDCGDQKSELQYQEVSPEKRARVFNRLRLHRYIESTIELGRLISLFPLQLWRQKVLNNK